MFDLINLTREYININKILNLVKVNNLIWAIDVEINRNGTVVNTKKYYYFNFEYNNIVYIYNGDI